MTATPLCYRYRYRGESGTMLLEPTRRFPWQRNIRLWLALVIAPFAASAVLSTLLFGKKTVASRHLSTIQYPQGAWRGRFGADGYVLFGWHGTSDLVRLPRWVHYFVDGSERTAWHVTRDPRALQSPNGSGRTPAAVYAASAITLELKFARTYRGMVRLYAIDWDTHQRREVITVDDGSSSASVDLAHDFSRGIWILAPVSVAQGGSVVIRAQRTAGAAAVLSGVFLS